jgi:hypothetical protein
VFGSTSRIFETYLAGDFSDYPGNMTWTELIAFWVTFALTFVGFISWFNLGETTQHSQVDSPEERPEKRN